MLRKFRSEIVDTLSDARIFSLAAFTCIFFAFAGPFGSFSDLSVLWRLMFWVPVFAVAFVTGAVCYSLVLHGMKVHGIVRLRIYTYLIFCGVFTPKLYALIFFGPVAWGVSDVSFSILASWVLLTAGTCTAAVALMDGTNAVSIKVDADPAPSPPPPRLVRRLERRDREFSITRLTVNDHYVVVGLCDGGEQRLLMRLSDAIAEMDDVLGFTTHRSHWINQAHIKGPVLDGKREMIELTSGVRVPVSRTYRPVLVAAGVLPAEKQLIETQLTQQ